MSLEEQGPQNGSTDPTPATPRVSGVADVTAQPSPATTASAPRSGVQTRQKRVLPSRSRRGGPGVGSCETDSMILETLRRRLESEPLIPASTQFLLTTNAALVPSMSDTGKLEHELNSKAFYRYFDRPEVQTAYKEQQTIQTPEFTQLDEDASVGGRFRPRGAEDASADTSDAVYEKRHRKYETFEKRQRLREKEKLKHEQYKLKERIEQLRAMDASAFLALPESDFPLSETSQVSNKLPDSASSQTQSVLDHAEGERRRRIMLDIALSLGERYRVLLPPDRKWLEKKNARPESISVSVEPEPESEPEVDKQSEEEEPEEDKVDKLLESELEREASPPPAAYHDEDGESEVDFEERERERSKGLKLRIKFPPRTPSQAQTKAKRTPSSQPASKKQKKQQMTLSPFMSKSASAVQPSTDTSPLKLATTFSLVSASAGPGRPRDSNGKFLPKNSNGNGSTMSSFKLPPKKRPRTDSSASTSVRFLGNAHAGYSISARGSPAVTKTHGGTASKHEQPCMLLLAAERNSAAPNVRKTQRHVTAFGTRVPPEIEEVRDFELPEWVLLESQEDDWQYGSEDAPHDEPGSTNGISDIDGSFSGDVKVESIADSSNLRRDDEVEMAVLEQDIPVSDAGP